MPRASHRGGAWLMYRDGIGAYVYLRHPPSSRQCVFQHRSELADCSGSKGYLLSDPAQEINVGLAADIGILQRLQKIVGNDSKVRELCLTGRSFNVKEAEELGLLSAVIPGGRQEVVGELATLRDGIGT